MTKLIVSLLSAALYGLAFAFLFLAIWGVSWQWLATAALVWFIAAWAGAFTKPPYEEMMRRKD